MLCHGYGAISKGGVGHAVKLCNMYVQKKSGLFYKYDQNGQAPFLSLHIS